MQSLCIGGSAPYNCTFFMPTKRKYSQSLSGGDLGSPTQDFSQPIVSTSRQLKPRSSSPSTSFSGSAQRSSSRNGSLTAVNGVVDIDGESSSSASVGNSQARSKKRKVDDKGKGKGRAKASENQVIEEEIDELLSDSENAGTVLGRNRGKGKGKGKARYVEEESGEEVDQVHELQVTSPPPTQPPVTHKVETSSDDIEVLSETRTAVATPPHRPEPLAQYTCPVCFCPPTKATLTPCGHILCGRCLFTAVKTTIRRGIWIGDNSAK
jgi:hypothetical protein